ncbi:CHAT domain-containing tetratricopeptide repeat protein, partial [Allocoleopsis sp.]|uniref:CHAT domain-containing tetratricopeptide repeat protein n=1 Tax=Allocoleopsis sp. TaxID=3088169 RepID=UPI002FCEBE35
DLELQRSQEKANRLFKEAESLEQEHPPQAIAKYQEALQLMRNPVQQVFTLNRIGGIYKFSNSREQAIKFYEQSLSILQNLNKPDLEVLTLNRLGDVYEASANYQKSLDLYNQALPFLDKLDKPSLKALALNNLGNAYYILGNREQAFNFYNQALRQWQISQKQSDSLGDLDVNSNSELVSLVSSTLQETIAKPNMNPRIGEVMTLLNLGQTYRLLGDYQQALDSLNQAQKRWLAFYGNNNNNEAQQWWQPIYGNNNNQERTSVFGLFDAAILHAISAVYSDAGRNEQASNYNDQVHQKLMASLPASTDSRLGNILQILSSDPSSKQQTVDFYKRVLGQWPSSPQYRGVEATLRSNLGNAYFELGKEQQAPESDNKALQQALDSYNKALKLWPDGSDYEREQAEALDSIGKVLSALNQKEKAIESFNRAQSLWQASGNVSRQADTLNLVGQTYVDSGQYQPALDAFKHALQLSGGDSSQAAESYFGIAKVERQHGNFHQAQTSIEAALNSIESPQSSSNNRERFYYSLSVKNLESQSPRLILGLVLPDHQLRSPDPSSVQPNVYKSYINLASYFASKQKYQEFYIDLLMQLHDQNHTKGYDVQALQASEHSRARSLRALLNKGDRRIQNEESQTQAITTIQKQLSDDTVLLEYDLGEERSYLWAVTATGISSYSLPKRADIEKAAGEFYKFLTEPAERIQEKNAAAAGMALRRILLEPVAKQLGRKRLLIVGDGILNYIPFSALPVPQPGGASSDTVPTKFLLENHEIVNIPSASLLTYLRRNPDKRSSPTKTLAVFADPVFDRQDERLSGKVTSSVEQLSSTPPNANQRLNPERFYPRLPGTRREAEQIFSLVSQSNPASARLNKFIDFAASRQTVTNLDLSPYRILHFATHGILDSQNPERSGIVLSGVNEQGELQRGLLATPDTFNLKLNSDLVVLSGCHTGLGTEIKGEGLVGLTGGFMYAGAKRVVVSLWNVKDEATPELMQQFYQGIFTKKLPPAQALREAQLSMLKYQPYYWAAFSLQGEWR